MHVAPGTRLGPYEITAPLGSGGMGEVYRAHDARLDRSVAIKILPASFAANPEFRLRFEREAKTISQLNHPNICTLHDVGHDNGIDYLVMELIEGESLADRVARGPIPVSETLRLGAQIAYALDRAHRAGIVHRDLKPGNVMITRSGVKLLDFGLAKHAAVAVSSGTDAGTYSAPQDATRQKPLTQEGTILGTFQYMAPEQLEGAEADRRTDIFALGVVLYEMATGRRAFEGKTRTSLIAAIVASNPQSMSAIQPLTPPAFEHVVEKCLAKDPEERWQSAHDVADELSWIGQSGLKLPGAGPTGVARSGAQKLGLIAAALLVVAAAGTAGFVIASGRRSRPAPLRLLVSSPDLDAGADNTERGLALSPDGQTLAYVGVRNGEPMVFLRSLSRFDARALAGTEGASFPFWSPDSAHIGFFAERKLKRVAAAGGEPQILSDVHVFARGGTWSKDGTIVFAPGPRSGLFRISAGGGTAVAVTTLDASINEASHRWPAFLPDGRHFLYYTMSEKRGIHVGSLDSKERSRIVDGGSNVVFAPPDRLLFVRERGLVAQRFDTGRRRLIGEPVAVAEDVGRFGEFGPTGYASFSVSNTGVLAFQKIARQSGQLVVHGRTGVELARLGPPGLYAEPRLSPDASRVVVGRSDPKTQKTDLWSFDVARGLGSRLTTGPGENVLGSWSPDGKQIMFSSDRKGTFDIYRKSANGAGDERVVLESALTKYADDWSADGRFVTYEVFATAKSQSDLWTFDISTGKSTPFLITEFNETHSQFSPDGKWLAYTSDESDRAEVYVQSFPPSGEKWQISVAGGDQAVWSRDGKKLYYIGNDRKLVEVKVETLPSFRVVESTPLFPVRVAGFASTGPRTNYDVMPDGQRIIVNTSLDSAVRPIQVVVNWTSELP